MSALPSPLKSPTLTSTQVTLGPSAAQVAHKELVKELPVDWATHHWPLSAARPTMSILPSPLKSPTLTSAQVTLVLHLPHWPVVNIDALVTPVPHDPPST